MIGQSTTPLRRVWWLLLHRVRTFVWIVLFVYLTDGLAYGRWPRMALACCLMWAAVESINAAAIADRDRRRLRSTNRRLQEELKHSAVREQRISSLTGRIATGLTLDDLLSEVAHIAAAESTGRCLLILANPTGAPHIASVGLTPAMLECCLGLDAEAQPWGQAVARRGPVIAAEIETDGHWPALRELARTEEFAAMLSVPVVGADKGIIGSLTLIYPVPHQPGDVEVVAAQTFAACAGIAVEIAHLRATNSESQNLLGAAADAVRDGLIATDGASKVTVCNRAAQQVTGLTPALLLGKTIDRLFAEAPPPPGSVHRPARIRRVDGQESAVRATVAPIGEAGGTLYVFHPAPEEDAAEQLRAHIVATVSHELRTPLAAISGFASTLHERGDALPPEKRANYLKIILEQAERMTAIVNDLLRIGGGLGPISMQAAPVDLFEVCERVASVTHGKSDGRRVSLVAEAPALRIVADSDRIEQVLQNLTDNALKYSPAGSPVTIHLRPCADGAEIMVANEGAGIGVDDQERIFQPFTRGRDALAQSIPGTGLGLFICKQLIERMGGVMRLESEPGHGVTVGFTLPAEPPWPGKLTEAPLDAS